MPLAAKQKVEPRQERSVLLRRQEGALAVAFMAALMLWNLPFGGFILYPFKVLATWLHEMSHGLVMLVSGAGFSRLEIFRDTSGRAYPEWVTGPLARGAIASAGYLGTAVIGAALLVLGHTVRGARRILYGLGAALAISLLVWVENPFGVGAVAVGVLFFGLAARYLPDRGALLLVNFVAAQACINAVLDIRVLFRTEMVIDGKAVGRSDAHTMAAVSFGNHWLWATIWLVLSFACFYLALRMLFRRRAFRFTPDGAADEEDDQARRPG